MERLRKTYETFKMGIVSNINLGFETLNRAFDEAMIECQQKDAKISELEKKVEELEKKVAAGRLSKE
jgi:hypothetical protein